MNNRLLSLDMLHRSVVALPLLPLLQKSFSESINYTQ